MLLLLLLRLKRRRLLLLLLGLDDEVRDAIEGIEVVVEVLLVLASATRVGRPQLDRVLLDLEVQVAQTHQKAEREAHEQHQLRICRAKAAQPNQQTNT